jgi:ribosomal protein L14E/L6E/L27E
MLSGAQGLLQRTLVDNGIDGNHWTVLQTAQRKADRTRQRKFEQKRLLSDIINRNRGKFTNDNNLSAQQPAAKGSSNGKQNEPEEQRESGTKQQTTRRYRRYVS